MSDRLAFFARLNPAIFDVIQQWRGSRLANELNPQPFPPKEVRVAHLAAAQTARAVADTVIAAGIAGQFGPGSEVGVALQDAALQLGAAAGL